MIKGNSEEEVRIALQKKAYDILENYVNNMGYSNEELDILSIEELQTKLKAINSILKDKKKLENIGNASFEKGRDFDFNNKSTSGIVGYTFYSHRNLLDKKKYILELIKIKSRKEKINSLEDLINNVSDKDLRKKIENELNDFSKQTSKIEEQEKLANTEEREYETSKKQLEISKTKLDLLEKKSQIWLAILAKESIASIIGALLLVIISICLLVSMFIGIEPSKIIESTFLLILGYFFGHAVTKK
ncbi:hypothetical protein [Flavobacterium sp. B183]|uniref:hypothetical protein n=1 Tax=Flavobacterium sp. B183 TaxID=907046 RepID=UPI00201F6FEE|nr:hypothetical protein [Flavobacterium sp. B183]URC11031.1 hypothetical protein M4I44_13100 [Flavobacterium sp. B183]